MKAETFAVVTACIAALASLANIGATVFFSRKAIRESQFRELLAPHVVPLGEDLHQLLACCDMICKRVPKGSDTTKWEELAHDSCRRLKVQCRRVKYPLEPILAGLRELTRLANWVDHLKNSPERLGALLTAADCLREQLDHAIREAYLSGEPPTSYVKGRVEQATKTLRGIWEDRSGQERPEEEQETLDSIVPPDLYANFPRIF